MYHLRPRYQEDPCDCLDGPQRPITTESGDVVCTGCGRVLEAHIFDERPEWYDSTFSRAAPVTTDDVIAGTTGSNIVPSRKRKFVTPDAQQATRGVFKEIDRMAGQLSVDVQHTSVVMAKEILRDFYVAKDHKKLRDDTRKVHAACALYFGFKTQQHARDRNPRTLREMEGLCDADLRDMIKDFSRTLRDKSYSRLMRQSVDAGDLVRRKMDVIAHKAGLDAETRQKILRRAGKVLDLVYEQQQLEGKTPEAVCAAALFDACERIVPKKVKKIVIAEAVGVVIATLNKAHNEMKENVTGL
jgi:transcription initiation factor TFIIIB Brf1 subunit/transcription initiation factor TFIIB